MSFVDEIAGTVRVEIERLKAMYKSITGSDYSDAPEGKRRGRKPGTTVKKATGAKRGRPAGKKSATAKKTTGKRGRPAGSKSAAKKTGAKRGRKPGAKAGHGRMDFPPSGSIPGVGSAKGTEGA